MSNEIERLKLVKQELDAVGHGFCTAKWLQSTIMLQNGKTQSCHHPAAHKVDLEEIKTNPAALHDTGVKIKARAEMGAGLRPKECQYCWNIEDLGKDFISDRVIKSGDTKWAANRLKEIKFISKQDLEKGTTTTVDPTYVEVSFSNLCNFKCSYCSPEQSSQWYAESVKYGAYPTSSHFNGIDALKYSNSIPIMHNEYNPYIEAFWKWWPRLYESLKVFRITGGEPLLSDDTYKVLDYINDNPNRYLDLSINTNACVPESKFSMFLEKMKRITLDSKKIKSTVIYTSADTHGKMAEYIRHGMDYSQWLKNVDTMLTELPYTSVNVMCAANIFSLFGFKTLLEEILALKKKHHTLLRKSPIIIDISTLRFPAHQRADIITSDYWHYLDDALEFMIENQEGKNGNPHYLGFYDFEIEKLKRFIEFTKNGHQNENKTLNIPLLRSDFYEFVNEHDVRRGTNVLDTFPELYRFYTECRKENEAYHVDKEFE